jgi:hypothetical protein
MSFVWFWTFWHWSKESFREGSLLRNPLHGIGSHWDEWFRHEASESDRAAIAKTGRSEASQRRFMSWLLLRWARETDLRGNRLARHFALGQLAHVEPFKDWAAFEKYRTSYGIGGISAVVLTEGSSGEPDDVRQVEALALPVDPTAYSVVAEGFQADSIDLETPRGAAASLMCGKAFLIFLALWLAGGKRAYPRWLEIVLGLGWVAMVGLILYLLAGPEPGEQLFLLSGTLVALWSGLVLVATTLTGTQAFRAWRQGRKWCGKLEQIQVRLRMNGGLTIKGGSAGLPFCLNTLYSLYRADPHSARCSWLWQRFFHKIRCEAQAWAATGIIKADGFLKPVALEPKLRACLQRDGIKHVLTPRQPGTGRQVVNRLADSLFRLRQATAPAPPSSGGVRLGFAAEEQCLRVHPCRHVAQAVMRLGEFTSTRQMALNVLAVAASAAMLLALHDLRGILLPPPAPIVVAPSSPLPDYLWVSLKTMHPDRFLVVLESKYWQNRRVEASPHSEAKGSMRAEIHLERAAARSTTDKEDGTVWIERRYRFLGREFAPGEHIGRYDLSYLNRLGHE